MRALFQPGVDVARLFFHSVLNIEFGGAVARECGVEAGEDPVLQPLLPFDLVEEVAAQIALAEEQP